MTAKDFFFIHIPKTGGTFVEKRIPDLTYPGKLKLKTHATLNDCKNYIDKKIVFSVVRNPYDWLESFYFFEHTRSKVKKRNPEILKYKCFEDFILDNNFHILGICQHQYLDNSVPITNILKTESLNNDLKKFFGKYGIILNFSEERIRVNSNKQPVTWTTEMKNLVYNFYKEDFERFGYEK